MSNDKPYTINVEVPTDSITTDEPREVPEILVTGLMDLFNRISRRLRKPPSQDTTGTALETGGTIIDIDFDEVSACDKEDSVIYHDSDQDN